MISNKNYKRGDLVALLQKLITNKRTSITQKNTFDNTRNLAPSFIASIRERYEGTRLGRQELNAEVLDDVPGALWTRAMIDAARVAAAPDDLRRIVVAIDPSGTKGDTDDGDEIGIVVAGCSADRKRGHVIADLSIKASPEQWGRVAVHAYRKFSADRIIAERNFGGAMVEAVIRAVDPTVPYSEVTASRGKVQRAEPVAALYEQGRVSHAAGLEKLEDQMCAMTASGYLGDGSPDRVDASVWALSELMLSEGPTVMDML
jgi:phage terminase large subunit-like protein